MGVKIRTIKEIRTYLTGELDGLYPYEEISALSGILIKTVFKLSKLHLIAFPETSVSQKQNREIIRICMELKTGKPIQYIIGETNFYNCVIKVNPETLIPRPETEELVDLILKENKGFTGTILDAGTGTGCIAIALAINLPGSKVKGFDFAEAIINLARINALLNKVSVGFIKTDILNPDLQQLPAADIIVSNPPYVTESEKILMGRNVLDFEPYSSLFVKDSEPLIFYSSILKIAKTKLNNGGRIYFEINEKMGKNMIQLLDSYGYKDILLIKDINGRDRIVKGTKNG
jgi:release factor glutamine methyltransferase